MVCANGQKNVANANYVLKDKSAYQNNVFLVAHQTMTVQTMENAIMVFVMSLNAQIVLKGGNVFRENASLRDAPIS